MGEKPFIKFYPSDFLGGTSGLSPAERGCYITLLCLIYEFDGPIERDDKRLARRCGAPKAAFVKILDALIDEGKITEDQGMLSNRRAEKALTDRAIRSQNATHAANEKWRAHSEKIKEKQSPNDAAAPSAQCVGDASQSQSLEPDNTIPIGIDAAGVPDDADKDFLWKHGVSFLSSRGASEKNARTVIGKWLKSSSAAEVRAAFRSAQEAKTGDPIPYITKVLEPTPEVDFDAIFANIAEKKRAN